MRIAMMDSGVSAGEAGGILAGMVGMLVALGGGIKWFFMGRDARLKAWEQSLDRREREQRAQTETRLVTVETRLRTLVGMVFRLTSEVERLEPGNAVLAEVTRSLHLIYPLEADDTDLTALARRLSGD